LASLRRAQEKPLTLVLSKELNNLIDEALVWEAII
jgi:hypothetical protein